MNKMVSTLISFAFELLKFKQKWCPLCCKCVHVSRELQIKKEIQRNLVYFDDGDDSLK